MNKTTFSSICEYPGQPRTTVTVETDATHLDDLLLAFKGFLLASGYSIDGEIEIVGHKDGQAPKSL